MLMMTRSSRGVRTKHWLGLALCFVVAMMLPTKGESFSFDEVGILVNETAVFAPPSMRGVVFDKAACTASFRLGPTHAAYNVFRFELCADHETDTRRGDHPKTPFFQTLSITAGGRTHVWRGWAAQELFERSPSGDCVFRFRDAATSR